MGNVKELSRTAERLQLGRLRPVGFRTKSAVFAKRSSTASDGFAGERGSRDLVALKKMPSWLKCHYRTHRS